MHKSVRALKALSRFIEIYSQNASQPARARAVPCNRRAKIKGNNVACTCNSSANGIPLARAMFPAEFPFDAIVFRRSSVAGSFEGKELRVFPIKQNNTARGTKHAKVFVQLVTRRKCFLRIREPCQFILVRVDSGP